MPKPLTKKQRQNAEADTRQYPHLAKAIEVMIKADRRSRQAIAREKYRKRKGERA